MLELSACIEWLFADEPVFAKRLAEAKRAGLEWVEFWTWRDKDVPELRSALAETAMKVTSFVSEPGGRLVDPATHEDFLAGVAESAQIAESLDCHGLIVLAGDRLDPASDGDQRAAVIDALRKAAPVAAEHDVTLLLEPLNTRIDHVGYFLDSTRDGLDVIEAVDAPNVKLLYDLYHSFVMREEPTEVVGSRIDLIGHVHVADTPGRHEPGTGMADWPGAVQWLKASGYGGRIGLEYMPLADTPTSMAYLRALLE